MKDRCTPATAARLKAAGFPQPDPEPGQVWYTANDAAFIVLIDEGSDGVTAAWLHEGGTFTEPIDTEIDYYAPAAPDILRVLGNDYHIGMLNGVFVSGLHQFGQSDLQFNENPAEACAEAWLEENEKSNG